MTDGLPHIEFDPRLTERFESHARLAEAFGRLLDAVSGDPEAEAAYDELASALQRWLDASAIARD